MYQHTLSKSRKNNSITSKGTQTNITHEEDIDDIQSTPSVRSKHYDDFLDHHSSPLDMEAKSYNGSACKSSASQVKKFTWLGNVESREEIIEEMVEKTNSLN